MGRLLMYSKVLGNVRLLVRSMGWVVSVLERFIGRVLGRSLMGRVLEKFLGRVLERSMMGRVLEMFMGSFIAIAPC
jgi:hypothetical protein